MSDHAAEASATLAPSVGAHPAPATTAGEPLFFDDELKDFDKEDGEAGRNICKMLSIFFFYTVIVMGLSTFVTYKWVLSGPSPANEDQVEIHSTDH